MNKKENIDKEVPTIGNCGGKSHMACFICFPFSCVHIYKRKMPNKDAHI